MADSQKDFGERVKQIVTQFGSAKKLADAIGVSSRIIEKYMAGTSDPTRRILLAMADAGKVSVAWLSGGIGSKNTEVELSNKGREIIGEHLPEVYDLPDEMEAVLKAFVEVMVSGEKGTILALTQNTYEFRDKVRLNKEILSIKKDMDAIKRRLLDGPMESDFKTQGPLGGGTRAFWGEKAQGWGPRLIDGGLTDRDSGWSYEYWARLKERGVAVITTNPLRLFYLHDLMLWTYGKE